MSFGSPPLPVGYGDQVPGLSAFKAPRGPAGPPVFNPRVPGGDALLPPTLSRPRSLPSLVLPNGQTLANPVSDIRGSSALGALPSVAHSQPFAHEVSDQVSLTDEMRVRQMLSRLGSSGRNSGRNS